jgi:hypothetical protein
MGRGTFVGIISVLLVDCTPDLPPHAPFHPPSPRETYQYSWAPPGAQPSGSAALMICVVRPDFARESSVTTQTYKHFAAGFSASLGADLDKLLVAKGVNVTGPHATYDDITYPDKKAADLALTPMVFLSMSEPRYGAPVLVGGGGVTDYIERKFSMTLQGFVEFVLIESLSRQKLWVKKLELEPQQVSGVQAFEAHPVVDPTTGVVVRVDVGKPLYQGVEEGIGDAMMKWYPTIAEKAWTYLNTEELRTLKPQVQEIREHSGSIIR